MSVNKLTRDKIQTVRVMYFKISLFEIRRMFVYFKNKNNIETDKWIFSSLWAFQIVGMEYHIHLICQMMDGIRPEVVQRNFMKYTVRKIKQDLTGEIPLTQAVGEASASNPSLNINCSEIFVESGSAVSISPSRH